VRARRIYALAAIALWLASVEVAPNLHLALHDELAPHIHVGDGIVFLVPEHRHADGTIHRGEPHHHRRGPNDATQLQLQHGANSLAHHASAVQPTGLCHVAPLPVDRRPIAIAAIAPSSPAAAPLLRASARGPPAIES